MQDSQRMAVDGVPATVHVVDDNNMMQEAIRVLLRTAGLNCQIYASAQAFLNAYNDHTSGCLLLDVRMPGMSGLELQEALNRRQSTLPIVFMTGHGDVSVAVSAMQSGAVDFITKPFDNRELIQRIGKAMQRDARQRQVLKERHAIRQRIHTLSEREREIMDMVVNGKPNKVIAADLDLSQRTVEIHRARVMDKMKATSLAHLVRMVIAIEDPDGRSDPTFAPGLFVHSP